MTVRVIRQVICSIDRVVVFGFVYGRLIACWRRHITFSECRIVGIVRVVLVLEVLVRRHLSITGNLVSESFYLQF